MIDRERTVRVSVSVARRRPGDPAFVVGRDAASDVAAPGGPPIVARIEWLDPAHAILAEGPSTDRGSDRVRTRVTLGPPRHRMGDGIVLREVVVGGWLVEVELESEDRASLRLRTRRAPARAERGGPTRVVAELPGRIARILAGPGDAVAAGQVLVVIEAMKMLNEVRAPRAGVMGQVSAVLGGSVDAGQLLVTLE